MTEEFPLFDARRSGREIKGKFVFRRKPGMDAAAFRAYWLERHGPIVLRTPEIVRYVQSHLILDGTPATSIAYDGITEIHWADYAAAERSMKSPQMTVEQAGDAANFVAPRRASKWYSYRNTLCRDGHERTAPETVRNSGARRRVSVAMTRCLQTACSDRD